MNHHKKIYIGTSGWDYAGWRGPFYPENLNQREKLRYYSNHFKTVELNSSFYRLPKEQAFISWEKQVADDFVFSLKINRKVTHFKKLVLDEDTKDIIKLFFQRSQILKKKLEAILIQLPPNLKFNEEKTEKFVQYLLQEISKLEYTPKIAFEFRNESWFKKESLEIFKKYKFGIVISHSSSFPFRPILTSDFCYIRLHGPKELYGSSYSNEELKKWQEFITESPAEIKKFYVYFNNDMYAYAPKNATTLKNLLM